MGSLDEESSEEVVEEEGPSSLDDGECSFSDVDAESSVAVGDEDGSSGAEGAVVASSEFAGSVEDSAASGAVVDVSSVSVDRDEVAFSSGDDGGRGKRSPRRARSCSMMVRSSRRRSFIGGRGREEVLLECASHRGECS
ncbi:MAG: hypothetical protein ABEL51_04980 [Salinibacter sp.]